MKIGLIDVDGHNFPNLALMKIAGWHKGNGDDVDWAFHFDHYDRIYKAKVFARWANRVWLLKSCDFLDYMPRKNFRCSQYFEP